MKKNYIFESLFILLMLILFIFCSYPVKIYVEYLPYDICTFEPLRISDIKTNEQNYRVKNIDYLQISSILKDLEKIDEIEIDRSLKLEVDLDFDVVQNQNTLNKDSFSPDPVENNIEKIKLIDRFINVRYIITFPDNRRIVLGRNKIIIMINDNFYLIPTEKYKKLLLFFSKIVNDEIDDDNWYVM